MNRVCHAYVQSYSTICYLGSQKKYNRITVPSIYVSLRELLVPLAPTHYQKPSIYLYTHLFTDLSIVLMPYSLWEFHLVGWLHQKNIQLSLLQRFFYSQPLNFTPIHPVYKLSLLHSLYVSKPSHCVMLHPLTHLTVRMLRMSVSVCFTSI